MCPWVCPLRTELRLVWQLALLGTLGTAAWLFWQRRANKASARIAIGGRCMAAITVLLGAALLNCDSELAALCYTNPLVIGLALACLPLAMLGFRRWRRVKWP